MGSAPAGRSRQIERSALTALVPVVALVPFWLIAMGVVWLPVRLLVGLPYWAVPVGWLVLGLLLFVPTIQVAVLSPFLGARRPTDEEFSVITPTAGTPTRSAAIASCKLHDEQLPQSPIPVIASCQLAAASMMAGSAGAL